MADDLLYQQSQVLSIFERIAEPFTPKWDHSYDIPDITFPEDFEGVSSFVSVPEFIGNKIEDGAGTGEITVPGLELVKSVPRGKLFSTFHPGHREAAYMLVKIFKCVPTVKELIDLAAVVRDQVNEQIFVFAWAAALLQRPDTRSLRVPPIWEVLPDKFIESTCFNEARTMIRRAESRQQQSGTDEPIIINRNFAASDRVAENRLSYFREDLGISSHHWHWHLINPVDGGSPRDRRGELFYYMHQQILARYDVERIANGLARVTSYHDFTQPIPEAYFSKLTTANGTIHWGTRPAGLIPKDINIPDDGTELGMSFQIHDLDRWRTRILHAIHKGSVEGADGENIPLDEETGINILGELIEASNWSPNKLLYGDLHNLVHMAFCYIHDPDGGYLENMGVIGDPATAMRDPLFYRLHKFTDSFFQQYKSTLQPYSNEQLAMTDITLQEVTVISTETVQEDGTETPTNLITTGWQESLVEMSRGLDFASQKPVQARVTHLQHVDFNFRIQGSNTSEITHQVVFRIFIAPIKDDSGRRFSFREQRQLMIELDKFVVEVEPGSFTVERSSSDSSVTIPFERTFRELETPNSIRPLATGGVPTDSPTDERTNFCGCGWPDHFLVPRGTPNPGMPFTLFVMATNWQEDRVDEDAPDKKKMCRNAASYCGILDQKYPDKRPMGFPFDRPAANNITAMTQFTAPYSNMKTNEIRIQFQDRVIRRYPEDFVVFPSV